MHSNNDHQPSLTRPLCVLKAIAKAKENCVSNEVYAQAANQLHLLEALFQPHFNPLSRNLNGISTAL